MFSTIKYIIQSRLLFFRQEKNIKANKKKIHLAKTKKKTNNEIFMLEQEV